MWKSLISIALGKESPYTAMETFFASVDWEKLKNLDPFVRNFFKPGMTCAVMFSHLQYSISDGGERKLKFSLLNLDTEDDVNQKWPLARLRPTRMASRSRMETPSSDIPDGMDVDDLTGKTCFRKNFGPHSQLEGNIPPDVLSLQPESSSGPAQAERHRESCESFLE